MKTKQMFFGLLACVALLTVSCETADVSDETGEPVEQSIEKDKLIKRI